MSISTCRKGFSLPVSFFINKSCRKIKVLWYSTQRREDLSSEASVYVHWPYCSWLCSFCNFNKYVRKHVDQQRMRECLVKETRNLLQISQVKKIKSIYFGGGTPSLAEPSTLAAVLETISQECDLPCDAEVNLEANPTTGERKKLKDFKDIGINRLSLGVQTLNESDLHILGRDHTVEDSLRTLESAKELFPGHVTIDLMFGRPGQTNEIWNKELEQALEICDNHVSLYQLTLERGTPLHKWVAEGKVKVPDIDSMSDFYEIAVKSLEKSGLRRYEVANFSKPGFESQHNLSYWQGVQYIGVGPGAHGRFVPKGSGGKMREARIQTLEPNAWMREVELHGHGTRKRHPQTNMTVMEEILMLGLRTTTGVLNERWLLFSGGVPLKKIFDSVSPVQSLIKEGLLILDDRGLKATSHGLNVIDSILPELILHLENTMT